ncbi:pneumococcal histidine triad protein E precursor%2C truncation [Streptococcus pneumoniae]|nr:pneumococcal histidine triad protein E precursor%2C truncation [Streptococcus pneumoniae]CEY01356.1 pneumococcal histidine triad protein E precursor%2C truncation [Streptococcus pneumoniae]CEY45396.1 pneumococcal histidine triad protein E precursor%2C truncation [Streptococcus pneumoniae]CIP44032.1 pneumococcal histidine triad protein E precursor%2C truncation [Streptococcus pneumoniae]CIS83900.1 pneumococcal histidine triad protein E precursor%2C truncation [Streptococcus pneumoniae]
MVMVFDANRIISEDSEGFVIPHGDHNQLHQGSN